MAYILTKSVNALCTHGGTAQASLPSERVKISGQQVLVTTSQFTISNCTNTLNGAPYKCATSMVPVGASRVKSMGMPVLLDSGNAVNVPTGATLTFVPPQTRVKGQ